MLWGQHRDIISGYGNYKKKTNIQSTGKKCVYVCACTHARLQAYACVHRGLFKLNDTSET